jgi:hypothetical protein
MRLRKRKSMLQRAFDAVSDSLEVPSGNDSARRRIPSRGALKARLPHGKVAKVGAAAAGLAGLTATSAGISSLRRRSEGGE